MPIMIATSSTTTVGKPSQKGPRTVRERIIIYEGSSSPRELLEAIAIQAQAALKGLEGMKLPEPATVEMTEDQKRMTAAATDKGKGKDTGAPVSEENAKLLDFCSRILRAAQAIDKRSAAFPFLTQTDLTMLLAFERPKEMLSSSDYTRLFHQSRQLKPIGTILVPRKKSDISISQQDQGTCFVLTINLCLGLYSSIQI